MAPFNIGSTRFRPGALLALLRVCAVSLHLDMRKNDLQLAQGANFASKIRAVVMALTISREEAHTETTGTLARLPARYTILDVIGYLLTNRCQVEKLLLSR